MCLYGENMEKVKGDNIGLYEPTDEEIEKCQNGEESCDFGICSECVLGSGKGEINVY